LSINVTFAIRKDHH